MLGVDEALEDAAVISKSNDSAELGMQVTVEMGAQISDEGCDKDKEGKVAYFCLHASRLYI